MKNKLILTDMDDVLVSWVKGFALWFKKHHNPDFDADSEPASWDTSTWLGRPSAECMALIEAFNSGEHAEFGELPATKGSQEAITRLSAEGFKFVVITAATTIPKAMKLRLENLDNLFGSAIAKAHIVGLKDSKAPFLGMYDPTIWIDDKHTHAVAGAENGHTSLLMDQLHNRDMTGPYTRVKDWSWVTARVLNDKVI